MIDLVFQNNTTDQEWGEDFFTSVLNKTSSFKDLNLNSGLKYSLSIHLIGSGRMRKLNKKHRGKNKVTDVLSFPVHREISKKSNIHDTIDLGDIFISLPVVKKKSKLEGTSVEKQLALLAIHGFLHLLGFDHEKSEKEKH
jgi:probable rRNA maturation factor